MSRKKKKKKYNFQKIFGGAQPLLAHKAKAGTENAMKT